MKGTEPELKNPKNMKELQKDNVSHIPVKEKISMKELRRFRAEVRKGMV